VLGLVNMWQVCHTRSCVMCDDGPVTEQHKAACLQKGTRFMCMLCRVPLFLAVETGAPMCHIPKGVCWLLAAGCWLYTWERGSLFWVLVGGWLGLVGAPAAVVCGEQLEGPGRVR